MCEKGRESGRVESRIFGFCLVGVDREYCIQTAIFIYYKIVINTLITPYI